MDKKLNTKLATWTSSFKKDVVAKIIEAAGANDDSPPPELLQFIYNYPQSYYNQTRPPKNVPGLKIPFPTMIDAAP